MIAFVRRERTKSKLHVKDLTTGKERKVYVTRLIRTFRKPRQSSRASIPTGIGP
ncbi:MAG: hypothetical protein IPP45_16170 [Sphingomonadales bacterium]|nr:hypothetical protein [Sphingomonadales bacterium]